MNPNYYRYPNRYPNSRPISPNDERFIGGGFVFPFLLGGVTGAAVAPAFWGNRPYYNRPNYYPYPPYYGPYYR